MYKSITSILFLLIIAACNSSNKPIETRFTIREIDINIHGSPRSIVAFNGLLVGLFDGGGFFVLDSNYRNVNSAEQRLNELPDDIWAMDRFDKYLVATTEESQLFVFDTAFNRQSNIEQRLSKLDVKRFYRTIDNFLAQTPVGVYYLDSNMDIIGFKDTTQILKDYTMFNWQDPAYVDSNYYIYMCSAGEWGGNIFFLSRKTGKWYSWPCYYSDLFFYGGKYHLADELGAFSTIDNPSKLPPADSSIKSNCCNCGTTYAHYYHLNNEGQKKFEKSFDVHKYFDTSRVHTLGSFFYKDTPYSLLAWDSLWILRHDADSVKYIQAYPIGSSAIDPYFKSKIAIWGGSLLVLGSQSHLSDSILTVVNKMSLLFIKGNKIDFYNYESKREGP